MSTAEAGPASRGADVPVVGGERPEPGVGTLASQVAQRIEADIIAAGWPVGESLGSEPTLRSRYGVGRAVLREAVRLVEHHQVARMRRGPNGGLYVVAPDAGPAAEALVVYLEYVGTSVDDLIEARQLLEPLAATLAAGRLTENGIQQLREALAAESTAPPEQVDASVEALHVVLAALSGNSVLQLFIDMLVRLTERYGRPTANTGADEYARARTRARRHHAEIVEAVIAGDAGRAEARLGAYLDRVLTWMRAHGQGGDEPGTDAGAGQDAAPGPQEHMAEGLARRIRAEIALAGWPVGTVIGSEAELQARYQVSRSVLREAARLLEHHSVARMRRGPGGGLAVGTPDHEASIDTMALYLEYMRVDGEDLLAVRDAIELGLVARVTARSPEAGVATRIERAVQWVHDGPIGDQAKADLFHLELSQLAGNPVLAAFLRILTELWRRHSAAERSEVEASTQAEVELVHRRIAEAMLAGDEGLARHRMRRHLAALTEWWH